MRYRFHLCLLFLGLVQLVSFCVCSGAFGFGWNDYKKRFLSSDGRIVDFYQNKISHSEGQAYGLLLAVANDDKQAFDSIWHWTKSNLQLRKGDKLFCWSWGKRPNGSWQVIDYNNAADGDVLIAWALYLGWKKWKDPCFEQAAKEIAHSIRKQLVITKDGSSMILPGYYGFVDGKDLVINPSYIIPNAYKDLSQLDRSKEWKDILACSKRLLEKSRFGLWLLPADWVLLKSDGKTTKLHKKSPRFGYDAWRVFLYMSWSGGDALFVEGFNRLWSFFKKNRYLPESVNLKKNCVSIKECPAGAYAALSSFARAIGRNDAAADLARMADGKIEYEKDNYFSASMYLLSKARFFK